MNDSTRRTLRTLFQALVAALAIVPASVAAVHLPAGKASAFAAALVAGCATVTKAVTAAEDRGLIPAWLYRTAPATAADARDPMDHA